MSREISFPRAVAINSQNENYRPLMEPNATAM